MCNERGKGGSDPLSTGNGRICLLKIIATQAEGLEYSSAFSYKERSRIDYPLTVDDIFSCLGDFCFQEKVEQEIKANVKAGLSYVEYNMQSKTDHQKSGLQQNIFWGEYEICLDSEKYKGVLRALAFLTLGKNSLTFMMGGWKDFLGFNKFNSD